MTNTTAHSNGRTEAIALLRAAAGAEKQTSMTKSFSSNPRNQMSLPL